MKRLLKFIFVIFFLFAVVFSWVAYQMNQELEKKVSIKQTEQFTINHGERLKTVVLRLQQQGIIAHAEPLYWYSRFKGISNHIKAGEYEITPNMHEKDVLALFIKGKVKQYSFTIIEGWTVKELLQKIRKVKELKQDLSGMNVQNLLSKLVAENVHAEGQFLPDTYVYQKNTPASKILSWSHKELHRYLDKMWQQHDKNSPLKNAYEALILASIVEKETGVAEERAKIAGVFINRLRKGMKLQTDPTVIYGMGDKYKGDIRFRDLRTYTPYNTYKIKGLPPTPIALPGRAAIKAVIFPEKTNALYFVAMGDGRHYFSSSLKEHNKAVDKYQRKRKAR